MKTKEELRILLKITDFLEWLYDDEACEKKDKLPLWAKSHIESKLEEFNYALQNKSKVKGK